VSFVKAEEGQKAIDEMNGKEVEGKALIVEKAKPKKVNIWS
jgi:RNA recognition motif-containing protein